MSEQRHHTIILGAGPSGLAAGYMLAKAGLAPLVVERDKGPGGLMRSIHRGAFVVDVGRKELYNRVEKVDVLWTEILGRDYREYDHRGGILFDGHVIDMSPRFQGPRRGMPWPLLAGCAWDFAWAQLTGKSSGNGAGSAGTVSAEQYFYSRRGRRLTQVFAQGFQEKLTGRRWRDVQVSPAANGESSEGLLGTVKQLANRLFAKTEVNTFKGLWRHPARGTGQICDALAQGIVDHGGRMLYQANLKAIGVRGSQVSDVTVDADGKTETYALSHLVSSIPVDLLLRYLRGEPVAAPAARTTPPRTVILVYLFLDKPPLFPHAWLQVTDPSTRIGRITNYSGFNGDMVPPGAGCICCEYYCFGDDPLLKVSDADLLAQTRDDGVRFGLIDGGSVVDSLVLRLPGADASQNRDNWMSDARLKQIAEANAFTNLYLVNRTETDLATLAGIEAAEAIVAGDRRAFDERIDPAKLNIRTESKSFSFDLPGSAH
jgi:protoporphyrinogen oxidase